MITKKSENNLENLKKKEILAPYEKKLLEQARDYWKYGDWLSLSEFQEKNLIQNPDREKIALLSAAGRFQIGVAEDALYYIRLAENWGIDKKLVIQVLIAGVHNSLGRAYLAVREDKKALEHIGKSISMLFPGIDLRLASESRSVREAIQIGLLPQAANIIESKLIDVKKNIKKTTTQAEIKILETEIELLRHELSLSQQRQQLVLNEKNEIDSNINEYRWKCELKNKSVSQLGQDLWVLEKLEYKRGGFFVEFGATDGVLLSNTFLLEKEFGWNGICAEPNPKFFSELKKNRKCKLSNKYIDKKTGNEVEFILADVYGCAVEYAGNDAHKEKRDAYLEAGRVTKLLTISLNDFLIENDVPFNIDYLSIDTEGSEYDILSSFPFENWNIRLITVEHNFTPQRLKIRSLLEFHGYKCSEHKWDDWYEK